LPQSFSFPAPFVTILVPITLFGWIFVAIIMFAVLPARRAVLAAYILAWLFLPQAGIDVPGLPDVDKVNATSLGALIGIVLFDARRLQQFRPSWVDIPMCVWCLASIPSALTNPLPPEATSQLYDGISGVVKDFLTWGAPYLVGRLYLNDLIALRELAIGIVLGGLIYIPLCLFELRMSPCLHLWVYGYHPSSFEMAIRFGGYRPMVFMQHGLMLGMWMASASLIAVWLWRTGSLRRVHGVPLGLLALGLIIVTILCKSVGAIALLAFGLAAMYAVRNVRSTAVILVLVAIPVLYMFLRAERIWSGQELVHLAAMISEERADSLLGRFENEDLIAQKAAQKPLFGWGGWGAWRVKDEFGRDITVSDGMWVIALGEKGLVGLTSLSALVLLPIVLLAWRVRARQWSTAWAAAPAALAMLLLLYALDNLLNAMMNPVYFLAAGGLSGLYLAFPRIKEAARQAHLAWWQQQQALLEQIHAEEEAAGEAHPAASLLALEGRSIPGDLANPWRRRTGR